MTERKRALAERRADAAEYAFDLHDRTMRDEGQPIDARLSCARQILDREWGKAPQAVKLSGEVRHSGSVTVYLPSNGRDPDRDPAQ